MEIRTEKVIHILTLGWLQSSFQKDIKPKNASIILWNRQATRNFKNEKKEVGWNDGLAEIIDHLTKSILCKGSAFEADFFFVKGLKIHCIFV